MKRYRVTLRTAEVTIMESYDTDDYAAALRCFRTWRRLLRQVAVDGDTVNLFDRSTPCYPRRYTA